MHKLRLPAFLPRRRFIQAGFLTAATAPFCIAAHAATETDDGAIRQPVTPTEDAFIRRAFEMRDLAVANGDQGFGAIIVDTASKRIVGQAPSRVVTEGDPTAHAEMEAIRDAARRLGRRNFSGLILYSSFRPCAMCEAAAYWANVDKMIHGRAGQNAGRPNLCRG